MRSVSVKADDQSVWLTWGSGAAVCTPGDLCRCCDSVFGILERGNGTVDPVDLMFEIGVDRLGVLTFCRSSGAYVYEGGR